MTGRLAKQLNCLIKVKAGNISKIKYFDLSQTDLNHQARRVLTESGISLFFAYQVIWLLSADVLIQILRAYAISPNSDGLLLTRRY